LTVLRSGHSDPLKLDVERAVVIVPTAEGTMIDGTNVGYIKVDQFAETTVQQFDSALFEVLRSKPEGLVIDMRGNPGGLLDTAVLMLSRFLDDKVVVTMRQRGGGTDVSKTLTGRNANFGGPIVVLIDNGSASASEIFAGVLRDYNLATLVGEHTYGKSTVQTAILLKDMSTAKITTARYYLPSGENFSRVVDEDGTYIRGGIHPEVEVSLDPKTVWEQGVPAKDAQLAAAIKLIKKKLGR
jgi:carboxyl-terminal processing protease